jgi:hypothetical protein
MFLPTSSPLRVLRSVTFIASVCLASVASLPACSSDKASAETNPLAADIVRDGTTSAALNAFLDAEADDWAWAGGTFTAPMANDVLPADTAEQFTWTADATDPPPMGDVPSASKQNGQVYFLVFSTEANPKVLRVFTALKAYTPSAAAWQTLVTAGAASAPITLTVTSATYDNDALTGDGGPHTGQSITFTIQ